MSNTKQDLPDKCARRGNKLDGLKEKDLIGIPWMLAFALRAVPVGTLDEGLAQLDR